MLCTSPGSWQADVHVNASGHSLDWRELHAREGLVNSTACPRFLTRNDRYSSSEAHRIGCCFKPAQQRLLATRRFATCDNATLSAGDLLRVLGRRRLALVGDSVTHQIWHALSTSLFESGEAVRITTRRRNEALQPRNIVADDVCSIKGNGGGRGGSELNLSYAPTPIPCLNGTGCRGMGVRCTLDGRESGRDWLLRSVCDHLPDEELFVPSTGARLLWWRINGDFSLGVKGVGRSDPEGRCLQPCAVEACGRMQPAAMCGIGVWPHAHVTPRAFARRPREPQRAPERR